jgi:hypothetical protein
MLWGFGEDGFSTVFILADSQNVEQLTDRDRPRVHTARRLFSEATVKTVHVSWTANSSYAESATSPPRQIAKRLEPTEFIDQTVEIFAAAYRTRMIDELLLQPRAAVHFCDDVRRPFDYDDLPAASSCGRSLGRTKTHNSLALWPPAKNGVHERRTWKCDYEAPRTIRGADQGKGGLGVDHGHREMLPNIITSLPTCRYNDQNSHITGVAEARASDWAVAPRSRALECSQRHHILARLAPYSIAGPNVIPIPTFNCVIPRRGRGRRCG